MKAKINPHLEQLMEPHVERMLSSFEPGLKSINWFSVNIETFLGAVQHAVKEFELKVDRANDIM